MAKQKFSPISVGVSTILDHGPRLSPLTHSEFIRARIAKIVVGQQWRYVRCRAGESTITHDWRILCYTPLIGGAVGEDSDATVLLESLSPMDVGMASSTPPHRSLWARNGRMPVYLPDMVFGTCWSPL